MREFLEEISSLNSNYCEVLRFVTGFRNGLVGRVHLDFFFFLRVHKREEGGEIRISKL
jgi:hypothetical protein